MFFVYYILISDHIQYRSDSLLTDSVTEECGEELPNRCKLKKKLSNRLRDKVREGLQLKQENGWKG